MASKQEDMKKNSVPVRLCMECRTTDASFPLKKDCTSCAAMISHDEFAFWHLPFRWEDVELTPEEVLVQLVQPWKTLFDLLTLS